MEATTGYKSVGLTADSMAVTTVQQMATKSGQRTVHGMDLQSVAEMVVLTGAKKVTLTG